MRLPWCDTIPAMLSALIGLSLFLFAVIFNAGDLATAWPLAVVKVFGHLNGVIVLPLWAVLRAIDWLCAGPERRAAGFIGVVPNGRR